jgi:hypothetical protein
MSYSRFDAIRVGFAVKRKGGVFHTEHPILQLCCERIREDVERRVNVFIRLVVGEPFFPVAIVKNEKIGASVERVGKSAYLITINSAIVVALYNACVRLAADSAALAPIRERFAPKLSQDITLSALSASSTLSDFVPKYIEVTTLTKLAEWLLFFAIEFIAFHEVGHVIQGHFALLERRSSQTISAPESQWHELMADETAVSYGWFVWKSHVEEGTWMKLNHFSSSPVLSSPELHLVWMRAVALVFSLIGASEPPRKGDEVKDWAHPHPLYRLRHLRTFHPPGHVVCSLLADEEGLRAAFDDSLVALERTTSLPIGDFRSAVMGFNDKDLAMAAKAILAQISLDQEEELRQLRLRLMVPPPDFAQLQKDTAEGRAALARAQSLLTACPFNITSFVSDGHFARIVNDPGVSRLRVWSGHEMWTTPSGERMLSDPRVDPRLRMIVMHFVEGKS